jgi:hypothetical protein
MSEAKLEQTGTLHQPGNPINNGKRKKEKVKIIRGTM